MGRICWAEDERELVIEAMAEALRKTPHLRYQALWTAGNALLAPDRQRKWFTCYSGRSNAEWTLFEQARLRAATPVVKAVEQEEERESDVTWVPVPTPQPVSEVPFEVLMMEVIRRVWERIAPQSGEPQPGRVPVAPTRLNPLFNEIEKAQATGKARPVRVALCGPMKDQFLRVKERVNARKVELVHVDNQKSVDTQDWKGGIDYAIVTRFIRHHHSEAANKVVGRERVFWASQGTEAIVAKVSEVVPGSLN